MHAKALQRTPSKLAHTAVPPARSRRSHDQTEARPFGNQARLRGLQAKLEVGPVDHPLEREADTVADQVMRMPDAAPVVSPSGAQLSRKCAQCDDEKTPVQRSSAAAAGSGLEAPPIVRNELSTSGAPLDASARAFFEPRFNRDFGSVRIHTGPAAAESAKAIGARAYTVGADVVFAEGQYAPANDQGRHLLAHELVHTIQQGAVSATLARSPASPAIAGSTARQPQIQRVGECAVYSNKTCGGQPCVPDVGKGTGFCRWSGTRKNGCICIPIEQPMLRRFVETVLMAALIAIGVVITVEALLAIVACFASGACELAALIAVLGFAGAMLVVKLLPKSGASGSAAGPAASADAPAAAPEAGPASVPAAAPGNATV